MNNDLSYLNGRKTPHCLYCIIFVFICKKKTETGRKIVGNGTELIHVASVLWKEKLGRINKTNKKKKKCLEKERPMSQERAPAAGALPKADRTAYSAIAAATLTGSRRALSLSLSWSAPIRPPLPVPPLYARCPGFGRALRWRRARTRYGRPFSSITAVGNRAPKP